MTHPPPTLSSSESVTDVWTDPEKTMPFFKGRVALHGILRAAGIGPEDEVIVPGFTCVVVPAAILYTGARPVYYDINPRQLNGDPDCAVRRTTDRTRAIIVQHTFGVPADLGSLRELCRSRGILLIEDCAHALGASFQGQQVGTLGDAAFASLQWSKPVTTGLGGIARINREPLWQGLRDYHEGECAEPGWGEELFLSVASTAYAKLFRPSMFWWIQKLYRQLGAFGIVRGSSDRCELTTPDFPANYSRRFGRRRRRQLARTLKTLPGVIAHRRRVAELYRSELSAWGVALQDEPAGVRSVPLRVPVRVRDRQRLLDEARRCRIELGNWFNAPLHPAETPQGSFGYGWGSCPHAEKAAEQLVNLPTHPGVSDLAAAKTLEFLSKHRDILVRSDESGA